MTDDFLAGGILPIDDASDETSFDADAVGSDIFLDDVPDAPLDAVVAPPGLLDIDDDDDLLEE